MLGLASSEGLGSTPRGTRTDLTFHASHSATRSAPPQEQSRYSASAAPTKDSAWRSAPCSLDHEFGFFGAILRLRSRRCAWLDLLICSSGRRPTCPKRAAATLSPPLAASSCVWTGRRSRRPWLKSGSSFRSPGSVCRACTPGRTGIRGLAALWLFNSRRQAHFLLEHHTADFVLPNVRAEAGPTAKRQARAVENAPARRAGLAF